MVEDFVTWLNAQLNSRGWSNSELHRRSGMANSTISMVLGGQKKPGWDFCAAIADALAIPPEQVFRRAGLLPEVAGNDPMVNEITELVRGLTAENREDVLNYIRFRYQQQRNK